ncbi:MAG TPA: metallophosphoesterase [Gaiellaceae bacterium]|nr:metallophosphoesterase [Gaiellaceae bacterium]
MVTRILHVSDLHIGARDDPVVEDGFVSLVEQVDPGLIVASGDLTHRGRRAQHERAAALLRSPGPPVLAVPGNHDIPYTFPARLTTPWQEFERQWKTTEPVHDVEEAVVVGLNSVRPRRHQSGGLDPSQLERAQQRLRAADAGALRMVVLHHQLVGPPWRSRKRALARRDEVLERLTAAGAELIVGGHVHQGSIAERREFAVGDEAGAVVVTTAPGLGQPRPHRLGEARGALAYRVDGASISVDTYVWLGGAWRRIAVRTFARGEARLG